MPPDLGKMAASLGVFRRDHWIVARKSPSLPIFGGGHTVLSHQVTLEHLHLLAVFEADELVALNRCADGHGRLGSLFNRRLFAAEVGHGALYDGNESGDVLHRHRVVPHMRGNNVGGKRDQHFCRVSIVSAHRIA